MDRKTTDIQKENKETTEFEKTTTYDFEKNLFVVKPVFKGQATETLGTVLIRLITADKNFEKIL